jgi:hypothetical protein
MIRGNTRPYWQHQPKEPNAVTVTDPAGGPQQAPSLTKTPAPAAAPAPNGKHAAEPSMGQLVSDASTHFSNLLHAEIELAKLELRSTVKNAGVGIGLFGAAAVVLVFSLTFGFLALAEGLAAAGLDRWLAFLIVFLLLLLIVGACVYLGIKKMKRIKAPERTIATSKETIATLRKRG